LMLGCFLLTSVGGHVWIERACMANPVMSKFVPGIGETDVPGPSAPGPTEILRDRASTQFPAEEPVNCPTPACADA
jgi:hypothetical protein